MNEVKKMNTDYILNEKVSTVWYRYVLASVVGVVLTTVYTIADGIFVGQGTGESGLAGVNLAWPAVTVILGTGLMLGIGGSSLISISLGQKDTEQAERILGSVLKIALLFGILLTAIGAFFAIPITHLLGATPDTFDHTKDYFTIVYFMAIPYLLANTLNPLVRADGNPKLSMIMVGVGAVGNIFLDWLFVIQFGWGTGGAALATGAGVILSSLVGLYYFTLGKSQLKVRKIYFKVDKNILKDILKVGFVSLMIQLSIGVVILIQNNIIYLYGDTSDIAIFCVAGYIISLYTQLCVGMAQGVQPIISYHYGANSTKRMNKLLWITLVTSFSLGIACFILLYFLGHYFIAFFGISESILDVAYDYIITFCMGAPFIGIVHTLSAYYQAIGHNMAANIISITRGFILQAGFSLLLPSFMGVKGIFYAQSLSDLCSMLVVILVVLVIHYKDKNNVLLK